MPHNQRCGIHEAEDDEICLSVQTCMNEVMKGLTESKYRVRMERQIVRK